MEVLWRGDRCRRQGSTNMDPIKLLPLQSLSVGPEGQVRTFGGVVGGVDAELEQ
jgi:hypothetical protein